MGVLYLMFFIIWPFGSVVTSFLKYSEKWTKNVIWAFVTFYGYTFVLSNETMDANRIKSRFENIRRYNSSLHEVIQNNLIESNQVDIIQSIVFYLTSFITSDFQVLMGVLAFIFGYFYSRNICYVLELNKDEIKPFNYLVLIGLIVTVGFWNINMFRFYGAAHIFFYAVIPFIFEGKKSRLWLLMVAVLLHFSFLFPIVVFLLYIFLRNKPQLYFVLFLFSFGFSLLSAGAIGNILLKILPSAYEYKISGYTSDSRVQIAESSYRDISSFLLRKIFIAANLFIVVIYIYYRKYIKTNSKLYSFFSFTILFMAAANMISAIPDGNRFLRLAVMFVLALVFLVVQYYWRKEEKGKFFLKLTLPFVFLGIVGLIRESFNTINVIALLGNPIIQLFVNSEKALIHYLPFL